MSDGLATAFWLIALTGALALYFLPLIIGNNRHLRAQFALFLVNLLFGWTLLGWFACLIWAATGNTREQDAYYRRVFAELNK